MHIVKPEVAHVTEGVAGRLEEAADLSRDVHIQEELQATAGSVSGTISSSRALGA